MAELMGISRHTRLWLTPVLLGFLLVPFGRPIAEGIEAATGISFDFLCGNRRERQLPFGATSPLLLCARCCGLFFGMGSAALWRPNVTAYSRRATAALCWLSLACLGLDWFTEALHMRPAYSPTRVLTGLFFGYLAACYLHLALGASDASTRT